MVWPIILCHRNASGLKQEYSAKTGQMDIIESVVFFPSLRVIFTTCAASAWLNRMECKRIDDTH